MSIFSRIQTQTDTEAFSTDAGARQRVSTLTTLGDYKQLGVQNTLTLDRVSVGTGASSFSSTTNTETLTTAAASDVRILQSKEFHNYFSGKSQLIEFTAIGFDHQSNITKRAGYFSSSTASPYSANLDGVFLESNGTAYTLYVYNDGTAKATVVSTNFDNATAFASLTMANFNVFAFDFLWLGGAVLRFWAVVEGTFTLIHTIKWAGSASGGTSTFMKSPNQPLRYEIRQTGVGSGSFTYVCSQIASEGEIDGKNGVLIPAIKDSLTLQTSGTAYLIMALRQLSANRDITVLLDELNLHSRASQTVRYYLLLNPTITGTPAYSTITGTTIEKWDGDGSTITVNVATGTPLFYGATSSSVSELIAAQSYLNRFNHTIAGTADVIALVGIPTANNIITDSAIGIRTL